MRKISFIALQDIFEFWLPMANSGASYEFLATWLKEVLDDIQHERSFIDIDRLGDRVMLQAYRRAQGRRSRGGNPTLLSIKKEMAISANLFKDFIDGETIDDEEYLRIFQFYKEQPKGSQNEGNQNGTLLDS